MAKVKTTVRFDILEYIDRFVDGTLANAIGNTVVDESRALIDSGQSPVQGYGRFERYSPRYVSWIKNDKKKRGKTAAAVVRSHAPASKSRTAKAKKAKKEAERHGKQVRPVNLYLSGEMLDDGYGFEVRGESVFVGMVRGSAAKKEIASYHNDGTDRLPQRRIVPGAGEQWAISIMRAIRDLYGERMKKIIRDSSKK